MTGFAALVVVFAVGSILLAAYFTFRNRDSLKDRYTQFSHHKKQFGSYTACGLATPGPWPMMTYEDWARVTCSDCLATRRGRD